MNLIQEIISERLLYAFGWTVLHSLWQAMLIAIAVAMIMLGMQKKSAKLRYIIYNVALLLVLLLATMTFTDLYQTGQSTTNDLTQVTATVSADLLGSNSIWERFSQQFRSYFNAHLPLIVSVWLIGLTFFLLRLFGGLAYLQHLRSRHVRQLPKQWQDKLQAMVQQVSYSGKIQLVESAMVRAPMMMGYLKPIILLPLGAVNALKQEEVEAILAHELAHILRSDYLFNILQSVIEVLFYFNPAVWWLSANIRIERENCCDDIAVELCGNSLAYAKALVSLQEMNQASPSFAMSFSGKKHQLLKRVKRILNQPQNKSNIMEKFTATCLLLGAMLLFSLSANSNPQAPFTSPDPAVPVLAMANDPAPPATPVKARKASKKVKEYKKATSPKDTLPKGKIRVEVTENGKTIDAKIKDRKITYLKIDGKEIPAEELDDYEDFVEKLLEDTPVPPVPPAPPAPEALPAPPAPPAPGASPAPVVPEAVPAPPAPPAPSCACSSTQLEIEEIQENNKRKRR